MPSSTDANNGKALEAGAPVDDLERGTTATGSTQYQSDTEQDTPNSKKEDGVYPDPDHDEVEGMDEGHLGDLVREKVRAVEYNFPNSLESHLQIGVRQEAQLTSTDL